MGDAIYAEDVPSSLSIEQSARLSQLARGKLVLEFGAFLGKSTIALASTATRVHSVDWHKGDAHAGYSNTLPGFLANLSRYGVRDKVVIHVGRNQEVAPIFQRGVFDLFFLDSFHERKAVEEDIILGRPLVKPGGYIAFHDYGARIELAGVPFGVTEAVDAFVQKEKLSIELVGSLAIVKVP